MQLSAASAGVVDRAFSGPAVPRAARDGFLGDGCRYRTERGVAGDLRIEYLRDQRFANVHVAPGGLHTGEYHGLDPTAERMTDSATPREGAST